MISKKASILGLTTLFCLYTIGVAKVMSDLDSPAKYQQIEYLKNDVTKDSPATKEKISGLEREIWDIRKEAYWSWLHYIK